jgi:hypothetical protein
LKPDFYLLACRIAIGDLVEAGGEVYGMARPSLPTA